ncbi:MAG: hypothetical protein WBN60_08220 [Polyangiales bacterium]
MKHVGVAVVSVIALLSPVGQVAAQYDYGPEAEGAEPSPFVDPDTERGDESSAELEKIEGMDGEEVKAESEVSKGERKGRGCAVDSSSSTQSPTPLSALLLVMGLVAFTRMRARS